MVVVVEEEKEEELGEKKTYPQVQAHSLEVQHSTGSFSPVLYDRKTC